MEIITKHATIENRQIILSLPEYPDKSEVEIIIIPMYSAEKQKISPLIPKRRLGKIMNSLDREAIYEDER